MRDCFVATPLPIAGMIRDWIGDGEAEMHFKTMAILLAGLAWLVAAGLVPAKAADVCADSMSTAEMRGCLDKAYMAADAELNAVWKKVMAHVAGADYLPAEAQKDWRQELLEAQRAWITFKERDCGAVGFEWYGGTGAPGAILSCLLEHTTARTEDLKARFRDN